MKLNKELAAEAKAKGICKEWYERLKHTEDKHALIRMFLDGIDFCISEDFPSPRFFQLFDGIRQQYGIFRNEQIKTKNSKYIVAIGNCEGIAEYNGYSTGQIFVRNETKLTVKVSGNAFVMIDIFDNAKIEVEAKDNAKVCINQYCGTIIVIESDNATIKVIHKQSKTYEYGNR
jgi:hypothetical protein